MAPTPASPTLPATPTARHGFALRLGLIATILAVLVAAVGALYFRNERTKLRRSIWRELETIADLKVHQLATWRVERMNDGRFLSSTPAIAKDVLALLGEPSSPEARAAVAGWLNAIKGGDRYDSILVVDRNRNVVMAIPEQASPLTIPLRDRLATLFANGQLALTDLDAGATGQAQLMELLAPVFRPEPRSADAETRREPVAAIVLRLRPERFIFPALRDWGRPSDSAEMLLVRRDGNELLFLNAPRHVHAAPGVMRLRRDQSTLVDTIGTAEAAGVREGRDYRGVPALAAIRAVPGTPWFVMAKIDQAEAYAPVRHEARNVAIAVGMVVAGLLGVAVLILRARNEHALRRMLAAEQEARVMAERLALVIRYANDAMLLADESLYIVEANDAAVTTYGYAADELRGRSIRDLHPGTTDEELERDLAELQTAGSAVYESVHQRKDGVVFPVEVSSRRVEVGGRAFVLKIVRDITDRKRAEVELKRANRALRTISECNQALVRATNEPELLQSICRLIVEYGGYRLACVGFISGEAQPTLVPVAQEGLGAAYLEQLQTIPLDIARDPSPIAMAARTMEPVVCRNIYTESEFASWRDEARRQGFSSAVALPLRSAGKVMGVLGICSGEPDSFRTEDVHLLAEMADDLAYGIGALRNQAERQLSDAALRESEERLRLFIQYAPAALAMFDRHMRYIEASRRWRTDYGLGDQPLVGRSHYDVFPEIGADWKAVHHRGLAGEIVVREEDHFVRADQTDQWLRWEVRPWRDASGAIGGIVIFTEDITVRKNAESVLAAQLDELRRWHAATLGRETRVLELKAEVNRLLADQGMPLRYPSAGKGEKAEGGKS